ncbi:putative TonB-dependent receptor [Zhongshania aliphaticivorans]|uniref:Putative TonB-dependent receptor n=1 Tax=Zhongshania aliphaticivorans TaxID=1470434 RepID=A0A5S9P1Z5_9GAMM|nr:TonB-dependent receptor [Zhongshania aliphaticivorans]CAA0089993.1 putative TonB-dependent receptor [Zhongshania aliphaticivorans]CAA0097188.1 putative TonB-dependent receptor [Zhongshania aliphaticivorans]
MKHSASMLALLTVSGLGLSGLSHALTGQIIDASGDPIDNASISIVGSKVEASSDANGRFNLDADPASAREIHITAPGYSHKNILFNPGQTDSQQITLKRSAIEQIDVTATPFHASIMESAQPVTVVAGDELRRKQAATLGETLKNEVGVHSSYFGPVSSSPIIRGLNGPRVLITQNGLDVSDASRVGPDHVVATEASTAEQIEILRGPATLFYGSGAIGGVVNIVDDRVPSSSEAKGAYSVGHNTVSDEDEISAAYTGGNDKIAVHVDAFWRDGSDYEIPGIAVLETEEEHEEEGHEEHADGVLENSASESKGFNIGGSLLLDNGYIGLAYGHLERVNGIPGHEHEEEHEEEEEGEEHEHEEEEANVLSDLKQERWQLISELSLDTPWLSGVNTRIGYTDYEHAEIEDGGIGTIFSNETLQARVDLLLQEMDGWRGALSLEVKTSDFEAIGEEAFTPPSRTESYAIAMMQEKHFGDFLWQLGARVEKVTLDADPIAFGHDEDELLHFDELDFNPYSLSVGVVWDFTEDYNATVSLTHAQRAPSASELFSYGAHIGTGSFEVGALFWLHDGEDPHFHEGNNVEEEVSNNIDLSLRKHSGNIGWVVNVFYNQVENYYYERNTGYTSEDIEDHDHEEGEGEEEHEEEHDHGALPVYVFEQADVTLYGLEAQLAWQFSTPFSLNIWGDSVRGTLDDGGNLPRIPPLRLGSQLRYQHQGWDAALSVSHYFEQNMASDLETETDGYTLVDAEMAYTFEVSNNDLTVYFNASNLTDEEARVHSSFLKNLAPLPGRGLSIGLRGQF